MTSRRLGLWLAPCVVLLIAVAVVLLLFLAARHHSSPTLKPSGVVPVGGGGFVTGLSFSDDGATRLVRTDTFGGYRWDGGVETASSTGGSWVLDTSATSLPAAVVHPGLDGGVLAVAVAPSDSSIAYMAYDDAIFKSTDAAHTWVRVKTGISTAPNDDFRGWGSRLVVDPRNPEVVYYGTQLDGLYETRDGGTTWNPVQTSLVPAGISIDVSNASARGSVRRVTNTGAAGGHLASAGISAIAVDRSGATVSGRSATVYAASYGHGIYESSDGGGTWSKISPAGVSLVQYMRVLSNGDVLVTANADPTAIVASSTVWRRHNGQWSITTPGKAADWISIAADPHRPSQVALIAAGGQLALSEDYGITWRLLGHSEESSRDVPWLAWPRQNSGYFFSPAEIAFDPVTAGRLWLTEGTGVWYADLSASSATANWHSQSRGIEQLVPNDVIAPPGGKPLLAAWDRPIFRAESLTAYPTHYAPNTDFGSAWSLDYSATDPDYVVASIASHQWPSDPTTSGYSTDGGKTWSHFPTIPLNSTNAQTTFGFGTVAVSTPGNIVWVPAGGKRPYYTKDGGHTWHPITLPGLNDYSLVDNQPYYVHRQVLAADKTTPGTFYLYVLGTGIFTTTDGGDTWTKTSTNTPFTTTDYRWNVSLKAVPTNAKELFLTPGPLAGVTTQPFQHSTDGGHTWTSVANITGVTAFGFGTPIPNTTHSTIYIAGYYHHDYGIYYSTDNAQTWTKLTTYPADRTATIQSIDADKTTPGLAYLSIAGGGWTYVTTNTH